jgi:anti-anti-sigma regulatory factor
MVNESVFQGGCTGNVVHVKVVGWGVSDRCPAMREFCESRLESDSLLHVHLEDCEHFDSTFLGTLLCLQRRIDRPGGEKVVLVGPSPKCREALHRMGAHRLFPIVEEEKPEDDVEWTNLACDAHDRGSMAYQKQVVEAHRELAGTPGSLGEKYAPVAEMIEQEFEARYSSAGA